MKPQSRGFSQQAYEWYKPFRMIDSGKLDKVTQVFYQMSEAVASTHKA